MALEFNFFGKKFVLAKPSNRSGFPFFFEKGKVKAGWVTLDKVPEGYEPKPNEKFKRPVLIKKNK